MIVVQVKACFLFTHLQGLSVLIFEGEESMAGQKSVL